jgi:MFS family permease
VLLLSGLPLAFGWIFSICATSVTWLYLSRFFSGIGSGILWPVMSLYLSEIADPAIRGSLVIQLIYSLSYQASLRSDFIFHL